MPAAGYFLKGMGQAFGSAGIAMGRSAGAAALASTPRSGMLYGAAAGGLYGATAGRDYNQSRLSGALSGALGGAALGRYAGAAARGARRTSGAYSKMNSAIGTRQAQGMGASRGLMRQARQDFRNGRNLIGQGINKARNHFPALAASARSARRFGRQSFRY